MYDLLVIGSGPAGLTAGIYARRANLTVAVIEKEYLGTGQIAESGRVDNYPGLYGINGFELGERLRTHAETVQVEFVEAEVEEIHPPEHDSEKRSFLLHCSDGREYQTRAVIYAAGAVPKKALLPGEDRLTGRGVSYCSNCDGAFYRGKTVAVLGGGDTALDDALYLSDLCKQVYVIHRREQFRGAESTVHQLGTRKNVQFLMNEQVAEILGSNKVTGVRLLSGKSLQLEGIFVAFGSTPNSELISDLVALDEAGYAVALEDGKTACEGLYVAGDVRAKALRQVVTAVSDGANALVSALGYIQHEKSKQLSKPTIAD